MKADVWFLIHKHELLQATRAATPESKAIQMKWLIYTAATGGIGIPWYIMGSPLRMYVLVLFPDSLSTENITWAVILSFVWAKITRA